MLIRRDVLEKLSEAHPDLWATFERDGYAGMNRLFQPFAPTLQRENGDNMSEDHAFCKRWTDLGGEIWSVFDETIQHVGREVFTGNYEAVMRAGVKIRAEA